MQALKSNVKNRSTYSDANCLRREEGNYFLTPPQKKKSDKIMYASLTYGDIPHILDDLPVKTSGFRFFSLCCGAGIPT